MSEVVASTGTVAILPVRGEQPVDKDTITWNITGGGEIIQGDGLLTMYLAPEVEVDTTVEIEAIIGSERASTTLSVRVPTSQSTGVLSSNLSTMRFAEDSELAVENGFFNRETTIDLQVVDIPAHLDIFMGTSAAGSHIMIDFPLANLTDSDKQMDFFISKQDSIDISEPDATLAEVIIALPGMPLNSYFTSWRATESNVVSVNASNLQNFYRNYGEATTARIVVQPIRSREDTRNQLENQQFPIRPDIPNPDFTGSFTNPNLTEEAFKIVQILGNKIVDEVNEGIEEVTNEIAEWISDYTRHISDWYNFTDNLDRRVITGLFDIDLPTFSRRFSHVENVCGRAIQSSSAFGDVGISPRSLSTTLERQSGAEEKPLVVFVHGWQTIGDLQVMLKTGKARTRANFTRHPALCTWSTMLNYIAQDSDLASEIDVTIFGYNTYQSITESATDLRDALVESGVSPEQRVVFVGHSMGGMVINQYVQNYASQQHVFYPDQVQAVTIASPHTGTPALLCENFQNGRCQQATANEIVVKAAKRQLKLNWWQQSLLTAGEATGFVPFIFNKGLYLLTEHEGTRDLTWAFDFEQQHWFNQTTSYSANALLPNTENRLLRSFDENVNTSITGSLGVRFYNIYGTISSTSYDKDPVLGILSNAMSANETLRLATDGIVPALSACGSIEGSKVNQDIFIRDNASCPNATIPSARIDGDIDHNSILVTRDTFVTLREVLIQSASRGTTVVPFAENSTIAAGAGHSLALTSDGRVWAWGSNSNGQLGNGQLGVDAVIPVPVQGLNNVRQVSAGAGHSLALTSDGRVWTWGRNDFGQLGNETNIDQDVPILVQGLGDINIQQVVAGANHSLALTADGDVWAWGSNLYSQIGDGSTPDLIGGQVLQRNQPVRIQRLRHIRQIAAGTEHSLALGRWGHVWAWGRSLEDQRGSARSNMPTLIKELRGIKQIAGGETRSLALDADRVLWQWGGVEDAQFDDTSVEPLNPPQFLDSFFVEPTSITMGWNHSLLVLNGVGIYTWGSNGYGQLGNNSLNPDIFQDSPRPIELMKQQVEVAGGKNHSLALNADGTLWAWGDNANGELGTGAGNAPKPIPDLARFNTEVGGMVDVSGKVIDSVNDENIVNAKVTLYPPDFNPTSSIAPAYTYSTTTDENGDFRLENIVFAEHLLFVSKEGRGSTQETVTFDSSSAEQNLGTFALTTQTTTPPAGSGQVCEGDFTIDGTRDDTEQVIAEVSGCGVITGFLAIRSTSLENLNFLTNLTSVGGSLIIEFNDALTSLDGLSGLTSLSGSLSIRYNNALTSLDGLSGLTSLSGGLVVILGNNALTSLDGLSGLTSLSGSLVIGDETLGGGNSALTSLDGLSGLTSIGGSLDIRFNFALTSLDGLENITEVGGSLDISRNALTSLDGLSGLTSVGGPLIIFNNNALTSLDGLSRLTSVGGFLDIRSNEALTSLDGTENITEVGGDISITGSNDLDCTPYSNFPYMPVDESTGNLVNCPTQATQPTPPPDLAGSTIAAGNQHSLALTADGSLWAWGWNLSGQLGDGTTTNRSTPVRVQGPSNVQQIAAGHQHSLALTADGSLWAWGDNSSSQLGDGTTTSRTTPVQVQGLDNVRQIAAGLTHSLALTADGSLWAWGGNSAGQLGDGTTTRRTTPVQVQGLNNVRQIAAGLTHSMALTTDGHLWTWGRNFSGQLGDGTTTSRTTPVQVQGLSNVLHIAAKDLHSLAITTDSTLWAWGRNAFGQLGDGTTTSRTTPVQVQGLNDVQQISAGGDHSLAITADGTLWVWGRNGNGQLGDGTRANSETPLALQGFTSVQQIVAGELYSMALTADGNLWVWGINSSGQLGDGTTSTRLNPQTVPGLESIMQNALTR